MAKPSECIEEIEALFVELSFHRRHKAGDSQAKRQAEAQEALQREKEEDHREDSASG
jgi:hypothetical protein